MGQRFDRIDGCLGRAVFRTFGLLCVIVAVACGIAVWQHTVLWQAGESPVPALLFSLGALASAACVPYRLSRKRSLGEAPDAMEGGAGDQNRRP